MKGSLKLSQTRSLQRSEQVWIERLHWMGVLSLLIERTPTALNRDEDMEVTYIGIHCSVAFIWISPGWTWGFCPQIWKRRTLNLLVTHSLILVPYREVLLNRISFSWIATLQDFNQRIKVKTSLYNIVNSATRKLCSESLIENVAVTDFIYCMYQMTKPSCKTYWKVP